MFIINNICLCLLIAIVAAFIADIVMKNRKKKDVISFKESLYLTDLPIITLKQGNNKINFLLDTGSSKSVILPSICEILEYEDTGHSGTIYGMEGNVVDTKYINIDLMYNCITYTEQFQVLDMSNAFNQLKQSTGVTVHGILGNSFFEKYGYVIDFQELVAYGKSN